MLCVGGRPVNAALSYCSLVNDELLARILGGLLLHENPDLSGYVDGAEVEVLPSVGCFFVWAASSRLGCSPRMVGVLMRDGS